MNATELRDPQYGESYEPFRFSIRSNLFDDGAMIPPADAVISAATFPNSLTWQRGPAYPWIFGTPGKYIDGFTGATQYDYVTPVYPVTITTTSNAKQGFLCAGHEMAPGTIASVINKDVQAPRTRLKCVQIETKPDEFIRTYHTAARAIFSNCPRWALWLI